MSDSRHPPLSSLFPFSLKDLRTTLLTLAIAVGVCILLQRLDPSAGFAMPVFVLAVLLTPAFCTKENKKQIQIHINNKRFNRNFSL